MLGGGVGNGFAGCTVDGASGMLWSCCCVEGALDADPLLEVPEFWPCKNAKPVLNSALTPKTNRIRRKLPRFRNRASMEWDAWVS